MARHSLTLGLAVALVALTGCSSGQTPDEPSPVSTDGVRLSARPPSADVVRGCDRNRSGVGFGGVSEQAFRQSLRVGPIALGSLRVLKRWQLPPISRGQQRFVAFESIAKVNAGANVTVAIADADRDHVGLIYDQAKFRFDGRYRLEDLDDVVRFEACDDPTFNDGYSQFDGGFVLASDECFSLDIYIDRRHYRRPGFAGC